MIWNDQAFLIAYKMTGTDRDDGQGEYRIRYWQKAGLSKPTSIRLRKVLRLKKEDVVCKIRELDKRERLLLEFRILEFKKREPNLGTCFLAGAFVIL